MALEPLHGVVGFLLTGLRAFLFETSSALSPMKPLCFASKPLKLLN